MFECAAQAAFLSRCAAALEIFGIPFSPLFAKSKKLLYAADNFYSKGLQNRGTAPPAAGGGLTGISTFKNAANFSAKTIIPLLLYLFI